MTKSLRGLMTVATPPLEKFQSVMSGLCLETCMSNLKSVALTVLELLAFNAQKFGGHVTLATPISGAARKIFSSGY